MRKITRLTIITTLFFCLQSLYGQQGRTWSEGTPLFGHQSLLPGERVNSYGLDSEAFREVLKEVPKATLITALKGGRTMEFPSPEGNLETYEVSASRVLSPELAAKYPGIRSFKGVSKEHPGRMIHFTLDASGFHGMIRDKGTSWYMDPESYGSDQILLAAKSQLNPTGYTCLTEDKIVKTAKEKSQVQQRLVNDATLRTFRLALACTGEYSNYHIDRAGVGNGTDTEKKEAVLAAMTTTMTRVNGIFENDLSITMELISNNDEIIFLDPQSDGLTNNDGPSLLDEITNVINTAIGADNYDIGHVFSTGGGGIAQVASPCTNNKARGVTGLSVPEGDAFDIDFVAHEMGHQFGATHTFNNSCSGNRTDITAVEPGSGSTIMAYAGICPPNIVGQSDDYFHAISIEQIWTNITIGNSTCANGTALANSPPELGVLADHVIPAGTPFVLEATATDANGDLLTYTWEQQDNEVSLQPPLSNATDGPVFRSRPPSESPNRFLPAPEDLLNNNLAPTWENLPTASRDLNFSVMVRDNNPLGGQGSRDDTRIEVVATDSPFRVTSQSASSTLGASEVVTVTWDVGQTNLEPINTSEVDIYLIVDGNLDAPVVIEEDTPNDGTQDVVIPSDISTNNARIMVRGSENIFFSLNQATLEIQQTGYALELNSLEYSVCQPENLTIPFTYRAFAGFNETTTFTATNISTGLQVDFSTATANADGTAVDITVSGTANATGDTNGFTLVATASGGQEKQYPITLNVFDSSFEEITLLSPANNSTNLLIDTELSWQPTGNTLQYQVELATDAGFSNVVETALVNNPVFLPKSLVGSTSYFWRVRPLNECGQGSFSPVFNFTTIAINSAFYENNTQVNIPDSGTPVVTSTVLVDRDGDLNKIRVGMNISHTYVQDLTITLSSPNGRTVTLLNLPCGENDDIDAIFDDDGENLSCGVNPAISGVIMPDEELSAFKGESILGTWTLTVSDGFNLDGGSINNFSLEIFVNGAFQSDEDGDGVLDENDLCPNTPEGAKVDITGCPVFSLPVSNFLIRTEGESCINNEDGAIEIAVEEEYNYTATLSGNGVDLNTSFTTSAFFEGLSAGNYQLCFTVSEAPEYEQCFDISISEPQALSVFTKPDLENRILELDLEGASLYFIELNGVTTTTTESQITLNLTKGLNTLKVSTDKGCQGEFSKEFIVGEIFKAYPNPVTDMMNFATEDQNSRLQLAIYAVTGQRIWQNEVNTNGSGTASTDLSFLTPGVYILEIKGANTNKKIKLIKQ